MDTRRIDAIRKGVGARGLDGFVILPGANMRYLLGFRTKSLERFTAAIFPLSDEPFMIVPKLDEEKARQNCGLKTIFAWLDDEGPEKVLRDAMSSSGLTKSCLGAEGSLTLEISNLIRSVADVEFENISDLLLRGRAVKDEGELGLIRQASRILEKAISAGMEMVEPGIMEKEVAREIGRQIVLNGGEDTGFIAVQSGPNTSLPHYDAGDRAIERGDAMVIDCTCAFRGYYADITRSFMVGGPTEKYCMIYRIVREAQEEAIARVKVGVTCEEIDRHARTIIQEGRYGEYFIHRTGHGLGLQVHEEPWIRAGNKERLAQGMVFTVEPGIYLPGEFGIRIEDDLIVAPDGYEDLTMLSKDLA